VIEAAENSTGKVRVLMDSDKAGRKSVIIIILIVYNRRMFWPKLDIKPVL
jgi:hypothetical protein